MATTPDTTMKTMEELKQRIDLYQKLMDTCKDPEAHYSVSDALRGKERTEKQLAFDDMIERAGLGTEFFDNADPLVVRAKKKRDLYLEMLNEKKLLQRGISIA